MLSRPTQVFFSSCNSVKFHAELLNYIDIPVIDIHGRQKQQKRTSTFFQFCAQSTGTLLCTDVAARGLDIAQLPYVVNMTLPDKVDAPPPRRALSNAPPPHRAALATVRSRTTFTAWGGWGGPRRWASP